MPFKIAFNLLVLAVQIGLFIRAAFVTWEAGPIAGGAFVLLALAFNLARFPPPE